MTPVPPRLVLRGLAKRYGATQALAGVDLALAPGEICFLAGQNGAGKSTLLRILAGVTPPDTGTMELDGRPYAPRDPLEARARGLAMIHQELALAPHLSVAENVLLGAEPRRGPWLDGAELHRRARAALALLGRAELDLDQPLRRLAPADAQRVEIARALALEARVLVLDEPTSSLSRADAEALFVPLRALAARGVTIVYVSHVLEEGFALATRYSVLRDGRSVASGAMAEVTPGALVAAMIGREVTTLFPRTTAPAGEVVLRAEQLMGARRPRAASLELRRGEVLGIAGLLGAGRTELLRLLFGLDRPRSGRIRVGPVEGARGPAERWRGGVGFLSEDRKGEGLSLRQSVAENLLLPGLGRHARVGWLSRASLEAASAGWIARLGVRCEGPRQAVGALSGGNQQKVALARLLAAEVDVLLLDEPTRGVDVGARAEIYAAIDGLRHAGKAILLVSSQLPELLGLADRIAVLCRGTLGPARPVAELDEPTLLLAMTGTGAA